MDEDKALNFLLKHVDAAEIYYTSEVSNRVILKRGKFDVHEWSRTEGYGVRVIRDNRMGFVFSNTLNEKVLQKAVKITKISREDKNISLPEKQTYGDFEPDYDKRLVHMEVEEAKEYAEELIGACDGYPVTPTIAGVSWSMWEERITNTSGIKATERETFCTCHMTVVAKKMDTATASEHKASRRLDIDFASIGEHAARLAKNSLDAKKLDTGSYDVVLKPNAAAELLEDVLSPSFSGENVVPGRSFLADRIGEELFSKSLTLVDDGRLKGGLNTSVFDSEGVVTQKTPLVEKGVLKGFLYDTYYANIGGEKSTGNAHRSSHSALPGIAASNMVIRGTGGIEEKDLVVHGLMGTHTANFVSGDFSVETKNAFYRDMPVKKLIITGNIFEVLKNIKGYGNDFKQVSSVVTPSIEFTDVKVVG